MLVRSKDVSRADAILQLAVARATLKPVLARIEVLGWLARDHPDSLVQILRVISTDAASSRKPGWAPSGARRARHQTANDIELLRQCRGKR